MEYNEIMIRYAELSTKRKNKKIFINRLVENVKAVLHDFETIKIHSDRNRMYILLNGSDSALIMNRLKLVFGIQSFSPVMKVEKDMEAIKDMAVTMVKEQYTGGQTFKITTHRADHTFEFDTNEVNRILGSEIENKVKGISVNVKQPDIDLRVEIRMESVFLSSQTIKGAGGLPVGSSGKGMLMLSGGIDSPVAGYLAMKKGVEVEVVHF
ncbi:MAG: THUMP domain-containing protein, partial [Pisciglobus halotolerans]|nr:THUMP domain-containing protein [Pisciglobus halotolerans]